MLHLYIYIYRELIYMTVCYLCSLYKHLCVTSGMHSKMMAMNIVLKKRYKHEEYIFCLV